jgi:phosphoesterase RecJ-like protein
MSRVSKAILEANKIAIYIHINVDSDAMGSALSLKEVLEQKGKTVDIFVNSSFPSNFDFYGNFDFVNKKHIEGKYDLAICLDSPNESRLGKYKFNYKKNSNGNTLCIDHHHMANKKFCRINFVMEASSTAEILYNLFVDLGAEFTGTICRNLLSGILTDTGKFSHSATPSTFAVVSQLLKQGNLKMEDVINPLFNSMKLDVFHMMQLAYNKIEFFSENKLGMIIFKHEDFIKNNITLDDIDGFPDIPLQIESVKFAILASEDDKGYFRVSFRSKGDFSAKKVAETFGGDGHFNASGCKIFGGYEEVKQRLIDSTLQTLGWKND